MDHYVAESISACDGNGVVSSVCGGIYPDKTALCGHNLSGHSGREGFTDRKREEFIMEEMR